VLTERFHEALGYASRLHARQLRKSSGVPYVAHLLGTAALVLDYGGDEDEAIAALLHDAVEDQGGAPTLAEIRRRYGDRVASIVEACSDTDQIPKPPWRERKEHHLAALGKAPPSVLLVTAADKLHNARTVVEALRVQGESVWDRFRGGRDGSLWYYRAASRLLNEALPGPISAELERTVELLESMARALPSASA